MKFFSPAKLFTGPALFGIVVVFLLTLKTHRTYIGQGDEPHYVVLSESMYLDHDLDLRNNYVSPWLRDFPANDHAIVKKADGREIPFHALGLSLLGIPVYALSHGIIETAQHFGAFADKTERWIFIKNCFSFSMMVMAGFLSTLLFKIFTAVTDKPKLSWSIALLLSLSPPLLAYGLIFFTELPSAFFIAWLFLRLIRERNVTLLDAVMMGFLPWIHAKNYTIALAFSVLFAHRQLVAAGADEKRRAAIALMLPAVVTVALWASVIATNYYLWGGFSPSSAWSTGTYKTFEAKFLPVALPALFMDRSFGLLVFAPIYALFPCGLALLFVRQKKTAVQIIMLTACYCVSVAGFKFWWGGWSPGPRYIVPIVPLLTVGVTAFIRATWEKSAAWRKTTGVIVGVTILLSLMYWQVPTLLWNQEDGVNLFLIHWFGQGGRKLQEYLPNFFLPPIAPQFQAAFYAAVIGILSVVAFRKLKPTMDDSR
jgi:hypothetical protein